MDTGRRTDSRVRISQALRQELSRQYGIWPERTLSTAAVKAIREGPDSKLPSATVPGFSSALAHYDQARAPRLNAALTQGLRDYFGAHTYRRIDREGTFHINWSTDGAQIESSDSH